MTRPSIIQRDEKGFITSSHKITLDVVGFSRGAASARMFASKVTTLMNTGIWEMYDQTVFGNPKGGTQTQWAYTSKFLKDCGIDFNFNFMGLMDTVPAYGINQHNDMEDLQEFGMGYNVDNTFKSVVHAVAMNENRYQFSRRSIFNSKAEADYQNGKSSAENFGNFRLEKGFMGAHSDIGGGYKEGDISNASLMWIIKHAKEAGIKLDDSQIAAKRYNRIDDPIIHDSVGVVPLAYTPGSEFRWAGETTRDWDKNTIFNTRDHLELSWEYIRDTFQNPKFKQFDEVKKVTNEYMAIDDSLKKGEYLKMLKEGKLYGKLGEYNDIKTEQGSGEKSILIGIGKPDERIRINAYTDWLNCHYGLAMTTGVSFVDEPTLSFDVCDPSATYD